MAATALNAAVETAGLTFLALYAIDQGWEEGQAVQLISTMMLGATALQLPIGWIGDRMDGQRLVVVLAGLSAAAALVWPWAMQHTWMIFPLLFVWGGLFVGIYTIMLAIIEAAIRGATWSESMPRWSRLGRWRPARARARGGRPAGNDAWPGLFRGAGLRLVHALRPRPQAAGIGSGRHFQ